jgi:hypothetical protein
MHGNEELLRAAAKKFTKQAGKNEICVIDHR